MVSPRTCKGCLTERCDHRTYERYCQAAKRWIPRTPSQQSESTDDHDGYGRRLRSQLRRERVQRSHGKYRAARLWARPYGAWQSECPTCDSDRNDTCAAQQRKPDRAEPHDGPSRGSVFSCARCNGTRVAKNTNERADCENDAYPDPEHARNISRHASLAAHCRPAPLARSTRRQWRHLREHARACIASQSCRSKTDHQCRLHHRPRPWRMRCYRLPLQARNDAATPTPIAPATKASRASPVRASRRF